MCIRHLLKVIPHKDAPRAKVKLPKRSTKGAYDDVASLKGLRFVEDTACIGSPKVRLVCNNASTPARGRKERRVRIGEAEQLKPERQAAVLKHGKRDRRNAEHRSRNDEGRVACRAEADRGRARRGQGQASVEFPRQRLIDGAPPVAFPDVAAIVVESERLAPARRARASAG